MVNPAKPVAATRILPITCVLVTMVLLVAGLWPFNARPKNQVTWLSTGNGVEFGDHGIILSSGLFEATRPGASSFCSLEIRLQPKRSYINNSATLLVFYAPENPLQFRLMQYQDELLIRKDYRDDKQQIKTVEIELEHAFARDEPLSFVITSGPHDSVAYRNGIQAGASTGMGLSCADFTGHLVLGDSPVSDNPWQGKLYDLAIYGQELKPGEIARGYAASETKAVLARPADDDHMIACYGFAEGSGNVIHNSARSAPDLNIPAAFRLLHQPFLTPAWKEFTPDRTYALDVAINIVGFIPFGFVLCMYLSWQRRWKRAAILSILAGLAISLTIEVLQGFIPSRSSGTTDLITNTFGTALGVALFSFGSGHRLAAKFRGRFLPDGEALGN